MPDYPLSRGGIVHLQRRDGRLLDLRLRLPQRQLPVQARLRGLCPQEVPPQVGVLRHCGPAAPALAACLALEQALAVEVDPRVQALRHLLCCGEWIRCHSRHIYMFHAARLLGYASLRAMARDYPEVVARARRLSRLGGLILQRIGGHAARPANLRVGGLYRLPSPTDLRSLLAELDWALEAARQTLLLVCRLPFPRFEREARPVAAAAPYYLGFGTRLAGAASPLELISRFDAGDDLRVGPLARFALRRDRLPPTAARAAGAVRLGEARSPFRQLSLRALELLVAVEEAATVIAGYRPPFSPAVAVPSRGGEGAAAVESPVGLWLQHYRLDNTGRVAAARLLPPILLNRVALERDLLAYLAPRPGLDPELLSMDCRQLLGSFDAHLGLAELRESLPA